MTENKLQRACEYLITRAQPSSTGQCGAYVRGAVDYGFGIHIQRTNAAKDYGKSYEKIGFKKIFSYPENDKSDYQEKIGDICIIQYEPFGHICMKTEKGWYSDFKQIDRYGGSIRKKDPQFDIYRYA